VQGAESFDCREKGEKTERTAIGEGDSGEGTELGCEEEVRYGQVQIPLQPRAKLSFYLRWEGDRGNVFFSETMRATYHLQDVRRKWA